MELWKIGGVYADVRSSISNNFFVYLVFRGMVTYRENAMIYEVNYEDISHTQKWSGVGVIAHELAHQFFGDSVTCEWWDTIW